MDLDKTIGAGILTPICGLVLGDTELKKYEEGFVFDKTPDIHTRGHHVAKMGTLTRMTLCSRPLSLWPGKREQKMSRVELR